jgi:uncharacterized protein (TIGR02679 family)
VTGDGWDAGLDGLLRECHRRLSTGKPVTSVRLGQLDRAEQDAIADLLGLASLPTAGATVRLTAVSAAVERLSGATLAETLVHRYGPITDRTADRAQAADARAALWAWLRDQPAVRSRDLDRWADDLEAGGVRGSVDLTRANLERALTVLDALPSTGEPLPVLAGRTLNDTHALDPGSPVATLVLGALATERDVARPKRAAERRALWQSVGVADDVLSSTVLVAGLAAVGNAAADRMCRLGQTDGRAVSLTLADLQEGAPTLPRPGIVRIVENPAVLWLAVTAFGPEVPPMVCTSGWPSTAAMHLLTGLAEAGNELRYHGDLDGEGVRIATHVMAEAGALPWRMGVGEYRSHVGDHGAPVGRVTPAPWDSELAPAMIEHGVAVLEETVWEILRSDLFTQDPGHTA